MKKNILSLAALAIMMLPSDMQAQNFDDYFVDKTLRIDYTFAGNKTQQMIAVDELNVMPRWYGKKQRLSELPVEGNGQITVKDHRTGKVCLLYTSYPTDRHGESRSYRGRAKYGNRLYCTHHILPSWLYVKKKF